MFDSQSFPYTRKKLREGLHPKRRPHTLRQGGLYFLDFMNEGDVS